MKKENPRVFGRRSLGKEGVRCALAAVATGVVAACAAGPEPGQPASPDAPTAEFREHHKEILEHLGHIDARVSAFPAQTSEQQQTGMRFVVAFLNDHIRPHAADEERVLYPVVDSRAGGGPNVFTAAMRHGHRVVDRWIHELATEAAGPSPDPVKFARRTQRLLGLLEAHFEAEEEVLLALLDHTMTREDFQRKVMDRMGPE